MGWGEAAMGEGRGSDGGGERQRWGGKGSDREGSPLGSAVAAAQRQADEGEEEP
jgi:hypothetical protein